MSQLGQHPGIVIPQNTEYAKEMVKHEAFPTIYGHGQRPFVHREFPKRIYKAVRLDKGGVGYEGFTVNDEHEQRNMLSRGYSVTQPEAFAALEAEQLEHGKLAAEREWEIQHGRISARATAEVRAAEQEHGARHLPAVPETPIKKRGRPAKVQVEV